VTGGSGFLGRRLVGSLLGRARVVGIDRRPRAEAYVPDHENMSWHQIDLGDPAAVEETFAEIRSAGRVDAFIHLAAYYDFTGEEDPEYERTNVAGLGHVLKACRTLGLRRFMFASSAGATRVRRDRTPIDEDAPADGEHVYARTKRLGEAMVREHARDFPTATVRLGRCSPTGASSRRSTRSSRRGSRTPGTRASSAGAGRPRRPICTSATASRSS
jgi:nucleoside-diphosphate-sugar epimerase